MVRKISGVHGVRNKSFHSGSMPCVRLSKNIYTISQHGCLAGGIN